MIRSLLFASFAAAALLGCDRAVPEPLDATLSVVSPDLSEVQTESEITLRLAVQAGSGVVAVEVDGEPAQPDGDAFTATVALAPGLNTLVLDGFDADGERLVRDSAVVLRAAVQTVSVPAPPGLDLSGALTATRLASGGILVAGGQPLQGGPPAAAVVTSGASALFVASLVPLAGPRQAHSATPVPERNAVLLVGGASTSVPQTPGDLVATAELVLPDQGITLAVPYVGGPIRRAGHQARAVTVDGTLYLYLVGGLVAGNPPTPGRGVDVLRYEPGDDDAPGGRLVVLSPEGGAGELPDLPRPVLVGDPSGSDGTATSLLYGLSRDGGVALQLRWAPPATQAYPVGLTLSDAPPLLTPRTAAAGAAAGDGLFLISGGRSADGTTLASIEAVVPALGRVFRLDGAGGLRTARSGHAATILSDGRILTLGGVTGGNTSILAPEITTL